MPYSNFPFTAESIRRLEPTTKQRWYTDRKQAGLQLAVLPSGKKRFYFYGRINGKPQRKAIGGFPDVSLSDARRAVRDMQAKRDQGSLIGSALAPTFAEAFKARLADAVKAGHRTIGEDERRFNNKLGTLHKRRLNQITRADIRKIHDGVGIEDGHPYEANRILSLVQVVFAHAMKLDDCSFEGPNPCVGIERFAESSRERFLNADEMARFWVSLKSEEQIYKDLFRVLLFTGARKGNVLQMRWKELDLDNGVWSFQGKTRKGQKQYTLPLADEVRDILKRRLKETGYRKHHEFVFPSPRQPWTYLKTVQKRWDVIVERADLIDVRPHDLRRTLGSWQVNAGSSLAVIEIGPSRFLVGVVDFSGKENLDAREGILRTDTWS